MVGEQPVDLGRQVVGIGEVHEPDRPAPDLVLVGGADAAPCRADPGPGAGVLTQGVELAVHGQDQRAIVGDAKVVAGHCDTLVSQAPDLGHQGVRVQHDAVADHRELAGAHHPGGQQRELVDGIADDQRVAGIVAALEAHDDVGLFREPVDDLALALVAPLGADDDHIRHGDLSTRKSPAQGRAAENLAGSLQRSTRGGQAGRPRPDRMRPPVWAEITYALDALAPPLQPR